MTLHLGDRALDRAAVIDDQPDVRAAWGWYLEELDIEPVEQAGPLENLDAAVAGIESAAEAAVCDYHLSVRQYASFDGAQLTARLIQRGVPSVLCTRYEDAMMDRIRSYRKHIPVLLNANEFDPDRIVKGFRDCLAEIEGEVPSERRLWRTLVRIDDVDGASSLGGFGYVIVPMWDANTVVRVRLQDVPRTVREALKPGARVHARVNVGAERIEDVFFTDWEDR